MACILVSVPAMAEETGAEFCADRPGKGSPTCTLEAGGFQLEGGLAYVRHDEHGVREEEFDYGALTLRWGVTDSMEAQILWSPYVVVREKVGGVTLEESGSGDVAFSVRHRLAEGHGEGPSAAVQVVVSAPTGSHGVGSDEWQGSIMLPVAFEVAEDTEVLLMPQLDVVEDAAGGDHHTAIAAVIGIEHGMGPVAVGAELWARRDNDPIGEVTEASFGVQLMWRPETMNGVQFDVGVDLGLNEETPDIEFGMGVSRRF